MLKSIDEVFDVVYAREFVELWNIQSQKAHATAIEKGWWDENRSDGECIALMHSELSEALESQRHGSPPDEHIPEFTGEEVELGDAVIRIMDFGQAKGLRIAEAILAKMAFNQTRPHKHGKQF